MSWSPSQVSTQVERLLPPQLVLELRAVGEQVLEQVGDDVTVAAQHRVGVAHLGRDGQRPGRARALGEAVVGLHGRPSDLAERLEGLHAAHERAGHAAG